MGQASSIKETFHGWICGSGIDESSSTRRLVSAAPSRSRPMERASLRATFRLRCAERITPSEVSKDCPVKLVVFDFDETLTLATFMTGNCEYADDEEKDIARVINFESPWVEGSRILKLQNMLASIKDGEDGRHRTLTVLTNNGKGVQAVINMLKIAGLDKYFSAVWTMPWRQYMPNGAYKDQSGQWKLFDPPSDKVRNHKADVLSHVTKSPEAWFPQIGSEAAFKDLATLSMGNIVLVDDQRANFQSQFGASVLRYCKVARYDADLYYDMRMVKNMGGIGAHHDADYDTLKRFVEDPWMCKETMHVRCQERDFHDFQKHPPVKLVVFDFDETLTMATFMPRSKAITTKVGWNPAEAEFKDWSQEDLVKYNFESPWVDGSRVEKLRALFEEIAQDKALAILTQNKSGVVAVLNLLRLANLLEHFSAIWCMSAPQGDCDGAFFENGRWSLFRSPCNEVQQHKADLLTHVAVQPLRWLPQLSSDTKLAAKLSDLRLEHMVLVDDERANFRNDSSVSAAKVLRYCKVSRYDETYRDCGLLDQMGGLGAHSDTDYEELRNFLRQPWEYPYPTREEGSPSMGKKKTTSNVSFSRDGQVNDKLEPLGDLSFDGPAQLLQQLDAVRWLALTFPGRLIRAGELRPLQPVPCDFVLGPASARETLAEAMASKLILDGYCETMVLDQHKKIQEMLAIATGSLEFERVPAEFEPYYLGVDSKEKHALIDFEEASNEVYRVFEEEDTRLTRLGDSISSVLRKELGSRITGRTNLMVRQTFENQQEEASYQATQEPGSAERETFISLVKRRRVCMMHFLGPKTGTLKLIPHQSVSSRSTSEIDIEATPGKLVMFLTERFKYSHTCAGRTTTLQTWLLGQRPGYQMQSFGGDMSVLAKAAETGVPSPQGESVVVNGVATAIGGDSKDHHCYWLMFNKAGTDTAVMTPISRYDLNNYYLDTENMADAQAAGKAYTAHQGYVDGIEFFDHKFFGISNVEAASMDPNQRKTLEIAYEAINMAGIDMTSLKRAPKHVGCFVGVSGSEWGMVPHPIDAAGCGSAEAVISNRVNFALNLKGASQTINTACSAGLVATHTGKLYLKYKDFDPLDGSICCGTQLAYSPFGFVSCCSGGMLSFRGRCFTYDKSADGYLRGEGVSGIYLELQPYSNQVFASMPASQANQDGKSASITAPNGPSQEKCIKACFREAKYSPAEVDCFETHGTGTALGDPIEVGAFKRIYAQVPRVQPLLVTSSKTNLGHLEGGAGMAGFIKVVLQVMRCESSPNIHLNEMNPHLDVEGFPAQFLTEGCPTHYNSCVSGVSSFGFGGTNAHAMAFSQNVCTSRDTTKKDYRSLMMQKIMQAGAPEIIKGSHNPEDWDSNGAPLGEDKIGKLYEVEVDLSGKVVWREVVDTPPDPKAHERFGIAGSFNSWSCSPMAEVPGLHGLFAAEITIGESGAEYFYILGDEDVGQVYYPALPRCTRKLVDVRGPTTVLGNPEEHAWCIQGQPGSRFRVEFQITKRSVLVTWLRIAEALQA